MNMRQPAGDRPPQFAVERRADRTEFTRARVWKSHDPGSPNPDQSRRAASGPIGCSKDGRVWYVPMLLPLVVQLSARARVTPESTSLP